MTRNGCPFQRVRALGLGARRLVPVGLSLRWLL